MKLIQLIIVKNKTVYIPARIGKGLGGMILA